MPPRRPRPLLSAAVCALFAGQLVQSSAQSGELGSALQDVPLENIVGFLQNELSAEVQRGNESMFSLHEFQSIEDTDCMTRLVWIMNETVNLRDDIQRYHGDISAGMEVFAQLLTRTPEAEENTWFWLLISSHERLVAKLRSYWAKLTVLALDQHHCFVAGVRNVMLDAVIEWKDLQLALLELFWHTFAFGTYIDAGNGTASGKARQPNEAAVQAMVDGLNWSARLQAWFDRYAQELLTQMMKADASGAVQDVAGQRSHHQDEQGSFVMYEFLRRKVFNQWAIDKGLLRGLIQHVWQPPLGDAPLISVADFGAGGGHYSTWLNDTGLVQSFAFDGTAGANAITGGTVQEINLVADMQLWRTFDWVFCLEVGEHIPKQYTGTMLKNLQRHAVKGLIMSWSEDWEGIGHVNCLKRSEFIAMVEREIGFKFDHEATEVVRSSCEIDYIARSLAIFRAPR